MNILWISHFVPYPAKGGANQRSFNLLVEASKRNRISLISFNRKHFLPNDDLLKISKKALAQFCDEITIVPLESEIRRFGRPRLLFSNLLSPIPYDVNWLKSSRMRQAISKTLSRRRFELVHFDTIGLSQYNSEVKTIPIVLNHHNVESDMMARRVQTERDIFKKVYIACEAIKLRNYERRVCQNFSVNLMVSELDSQRLKAANPRAVTRVIPNGVDVNYFHPELSYESEEQALLFTGGRWYANEDAILYFLQKMWPTLCDRIPDLKLYIVGRGWEKLKKREIPKKENIVCPGFVDDIRVWFRKARVVICPMRTGGGTRLKILDALASGKAIVATEMACEGIDVTNGKNILIENTPNGFCAKIVTLFSNSAIRASLGKEARRLVEEKYSWTIIGEKLSEAYESALS